MSIKFHINRVKFPRYASSLSALTHAKQLAILAMKFLQSVKHPLCILDGFQMRKVKPPLF